MFCLVEDSRGLFSCLCLGARLGGRTATQRSEKGSEKGSGKGSGKGFSEGQRRFLGRGCDEALFSEKKEFSVSRGEAIQ